MTFKRAYALGASLLTAATLLPFAAPPAAAQGTGQGTGQRMAGRWQCQSGIRDPQGRKLATAWNYVLLLYPNGTFAAQGIIQGGAGRSQFQAQGRWQVNKEGDRWTIVVQGQQVMQQQYGGGQRSTFYTGGTIYSLNRFGNSSRTQDGQMVATVCQRQG